MNFLMFKLVLEKAEEPEILESKIPVGGGAWMRIKHKLQSQNHYEV